MSECTKCMVENYKNPLPKQTLENVEEFRGRRGGRRRGGYRRGYRNWSGGYRGFGYWPYSYGRNVYNPYYYDYPYSYNQPVIRNVVAPSPVNNVSQNVLTLAVGALLAVVVWKTFKK